MIAKGFRKSILSFIAVMLLILTFTASSYAWFDLSITNIVGQLDINVTSGPEIEMSLDGENYKTSLTGADFQKVLGYKNKFTLTNVTTTNLTEFYRLDGVSNGQIEYEEINRDQNKYFFCVPIWFRASKIDAQIINKSTPKIYLLDLVQDTHEDDSPVSYDNCSKVEGTWLVSRGVKFVSDYDYINENGETIKAADKTVITQYASDAMRVGFITPTGREAKIFDLSYTATTSGCGTGFGAVSYYNASSLTEEITSDMYGGLTYDNIMTSLTTNFTASIRDDEVDSSILTLVKDEDVDSNYWAGQVYLCIWLEGWDVNCYGEIYNDVIKCQLQFGLAG